MSQRTYHLIDEDEAVEVTRFGGPPEFLFIGHHARWAALRENYIHGAIDVEEFEAEVERMMRKFEVPA